ncbi:hypothetical protein [Pectobacterium versatile]|uniref:hypothetical protein n=1 Tax=Pectobacterium versatile TaxID=2488639 RepID=UPI00102E8B66|nr:hypothetical protein [Pectobacterium versatile]TAI99798.1 hypothetical protein EG332_04100 [Pectobacterium versatile]UEQ10449.1 hypothetical protein LLE50_04885 [Pectobacterium versatile]
MTVSTEISHEEYTGNGVTTSFPYRFRVTNPSFMLVKTADLNGNEATLILNTDYTLTGVKSYSGGNVVLATALPNGWRILLERNMPLLQNTDLRNQGTFLPEVHEDAFDYMTMLIQKVAGRFNLALRRPSWISNNYDAQGYKISSLGAPTAANDAANKGYVDGEIGSANANSEALFGRTLRVPGSYIAPLPPLVDGEGKTIVVLGGAPRWITPESGTATDVLVQLGSPNGSSLVYGSNAWIIGEYQGDEISIGLEISNHQKYWLSGRLYRVYGGSGTVQSVSGNVVTLSNSSRVYLIDQAYHEGDVRAWGIKKTNTDELNTELFQACINYASGIDILNTPTTVAELFAIHQHCEIIVNIGFRCHPVKIYHTTSIKSNHALGSSFSDDDCITFVVDSSVNACLEFAPDSILANHTGTQYFYGGGIYGLATKVIGNASCGAFVKSTFHLGFEIKQCRHLGAEFFYYLSDGWNFVLENNISNTLCGGLRAYRCTAGQVIGGYYNFLALQTNPIAFDYVLASAIEASNRDVATKSVNKFSRGIHLLSSTVSFFGAIFEHWDIAHAQWGGGVDKNTSCYFEGIKHVIYAITQTSGTFNPMTINVLVNDSCRLIELNNTSGAGRDSISVDLRGITISTSKLGRIGYSIYSGGKSRIIVDKESLSLIRFSLVNIYGSNVQYPIYIETAEKPELYVSQDGSISASGTFGNPTKDLFSALAISSLFTHKDGVDITVSGSVNYSDENKTSIDVYVPVTIHGGFINLSNSADRISQIIGENININDCSILVSESGISRTYRNIFAPKLEANYKLKNVQLNINSVFLIGDYTNSAKTVILRLENVTQTGSGGIIRNVPASNEQILFTYIKQASTISGSETGSNIVNLSSVSI